MKTPRQTRPKPPRPAEKDAPVFDLAKLLELPPLRTAVSGAPQTFGFENCVDLVWKLYWEIARLAHATPNDPIDMKCFAFNAAVTAWHLTDWVFEDMTPAERRQHGVARLSDLQSLARKKCRALHLCRQIATASKHRIVTKYADPSVRASLAVVPQKNGQYAPWAAIISDGSTTHVAIDVLEDARMYWYKFIDDLGMID